jgi:hypothetical protein
MQFFLLPCIPYCLVFVLSSISMLTLPIQLSMSVGLSALPYAFRFGGFAPSFAATHDSAWLYDARPVGHMPPDNLADSR